MVWCLMARKEEYMSAGSWRTVPLPPNWGAIRAFVITRDPQCTWGSIREDMAEPGRCLNRSTDADHTGDPNDHSPEALRGLCTNHHATRTGRQGAAGKAAVMRTRKRPRDKHPGFKS
jgi:hypothetical protein